MFVTNLNACAEFLAGDHTHLRELLHPARSRLHLHYSLAHGRIGPRQRSKRHRLESSEVYYFLAGEGCFRIGEESATVQAGSVVYVPPGTTQWVENVGDEGLEFLCLVDPAWKLEDEEVFE